MGVQGRRVCSGLGAVSSWQEVGETGSSSAVFDVEAAVTFVSWDGGLVLRVLCPLHFVFVCAQRGKRIVSYFRCLRLQSAVSQGVLVSLVEDGMQKPSRGEGAHKFVHGCWTVTACRPTGR